MVWGDASPHWSAGAKSQLGAWTGDEVPKSLSVLITVILNKIFHYFQPCDLVSSLQDMLEER